MTISSELTARLTLARAITAEFTRLQPGTDWEEYALRLNTALLGLIGAIDDSQYAASGTLPDTSTVISARDLMTVLGALSDGSAYRMARGNLVTSMRYRSLARALGDDR